MSKSSKELLQEAHSMLAVTPDLALKIKELKDGRV